MLLQRSAQKSSWKKKKEMSTQVAVYDFTLKRQSESAEDVRAELAPLCKKYTYQLEKGDTGYEHWQGRVSLRKKRRKIELLKLIPQKSILSVAHWTPTSNNAKGDAFYVTKADTRIDGPWTDQDKKKAYIPRQLREIVKLRPFQQHIVDHAEDWDTRTINCVIEHEGNNGKSIIATYLGVHGLGRMLPPFRDYQDLLACVLDTLPTDLSEAPKVYVIDMPRAMKKEALHGMFSAIETLKSGYAFDKRYSFRDAYFDCPNVWVFTNSMPDLHDLSRDRWKLWGIDKSYNLIPYVSK